MIIGATPVGTSYLNINFKKKIFSTKKKNAIINNINKFINKNISDCNIV